MADDLTLKSKAAVIALINRDNGTSLADAVLELGLPSQATTGTLNTQITLTAKKGSGYSGSQTFNYNRLQLTADIATVAGKDLTFPAGEQTKISEIIPQINALLGINLTEDDYEDGPLPQFTGGIPNEEHDVQVTAKADSPAYLGSLTFKLHSQDIDLASVLTKTQLDGLTYAPPAAAPAAPTN